MSDERYDWTLASLYFDTFNSRYNFAIFYAELFTADFALVFFKARFYQFTLNYISDCSSKPIKLSQYSEFELTTPGYPAAHTGSLSCTMRFEAPPGMKPILEFLVWELADCGSDRINVIDRKEMISKLDQVSTNYPDRPRTGRTTGSGMTGQF